MGTTLKQEITVKCDSPKCDKTMTWIEQDVQKSPDALPNDAYRVLILQDFKGNRFVFCSGGCVRQYLKSYVDPLSPREEMAVAQANAAVEAKHKEKELKKQFELNTGTKVEGQFNPTLKPSGYFDSDFRNQPDGSFDTTAEQIAIAENEGMLGD